MVGSRLSITATLQVRKRHGSGHQHLRTLQIVKAKNAQGRMFYFSVIELVEGNLLDDVWHRMSAGKQSSVVAEVVEALEQIHSVRPCEIALSWEDERPTVTVVQ